MPGIPGSSHARRRLRRRARRKLGEVAAPLLRFHQNMMLLETLESQKVELGVMAPKNTRSCIITCVLMFVVVHVDKLGLALCDALNRRGICWLLQVDGVRCRRRKQRMLPLLADRRHAAILEQLLDFEKATASSQGDNPCPCSAARSVLHARTHARTRLLFDHPSIRPSVS